MALSLQRWIGVGKVAAVTGVSSGIGAAIAEFLVDKGLIVAGLTLPSECDIVKEKAKQLSGKPGQLHAVAADLTKEQEVVDAFEWIRTNLGCVHVLVNNAGIAKENFLSDGDAAEWRATFDVNVLGLCIATREAVQMMTANEIDGQIVHINSVAGHKAVYFPGINVYSASKHAVTALTETLRHEFRARCQKIKVTSVSPGFVATGMTILNKNYSDERKKILQSQPMMQPKDVAEAVGYVLSTPEHVEIRELTVAPVGENS